MTQIPVLLALVILGITVQEDPQHLPSIFVLQAITARKVQHLQENAQLAHTKNLIEHQYVMIVWKQLIAMLKVYQHLKSAQEDIFAHQKVSSQLHVPEVLITQRKAKLISQSVDNVILDISVVLKA